uniref:DA-P36 family member n=1 Tax=Rhipicephalus zambeziensis TaxID=60191 RepID=A0A224Y8V6_9ACAR
MQTSYAEAILVLVLLSMVIRAGSFQMNLTRVAERYINIMNKTMRGQISRWSLTEACTSRKSTPTEHPVTAQIDWMIYGDCNPYWYRGRERKHCTGLFSWSARASIICPFKLQRNIALPIKYPWLERKVYNLDLNNIPVGSVIYHWSPKGHETRVYGPKCHFVAKITFIGNFAYYIKDSSTGKLKCESVGIIKLKNSTEGLVVERGNLTYYVWGIYFENIWCTQQKK